MFSIDPSTAFCLLPTASAFCLLPFQHSVFNIKNLVRQRGDSGIVAHHEHQPAFLVREVAKDFGNQPAGFGVEHAGGLIGEDDGRIAGQRARHRHALLFAAAQVFRQVVHPLRQADARQQVASLRAPLLAPVALSG